MSDNFHTLQSNPQSQAVRWLLEMEMVMDPNVQNAMILNIKKLDPAIEDVQLLFDSQNKALLVYLDIRLGWWGRWRKWDQVILDATEDMLDQALPSYRKRVVTDYSIFKKALDIVGAR